MSVDIFFPQSRYTIATNLQNSSYLKHLTNSPQDQIAKNGVKFNTTNALIEYYISCTTPVPIMYRNSIHRAVQSLYDTFPTLPLHKVGFVLIRQHSNLEFKGNAFTINNIVFLTTSLLTKPELIQHEVVHVLQRYAVSFFHRLYTDLGYSRASQAEIQLIKRIVSQSKMTFTDNPDESLSSNYVYLDRNNIYILRNHTSTGKLQVDLNNSTIADLPYSTKEHILDLRVSKDSNAEMFATLLSDSRKTVQDTLRRFMQGVF